MLRLIIVTFTLIFSSAAISDGILIAYPETRSFYQPFYNDLIAALKSSLTASGISQQVFHVIDMKTDPKTILTLSKEQKFDGMILLGGAGLRLSSILEGKTDIPIVTGSNNISPENRGISGVSILTEPRPLLDFVHRLLTHHKSLVMVANPKNDSYFLQVAKEQSKALGFSLAIKEATTLQEATKSFDTTVPGLNKQNDILWLSMDPTVMETGTMFPTILMNAWKHQIPIISNTFSHVGVMVGAYPNPHKYGAQIVDMLIAHINVGQKWHPKVELAENINITFNAIFASHLGIQLPQSMRQEVSKIYE